MISSLRLRDLRSHRDTTLELGPITVLAGPNGSGKTTVLRALGQAAELLRGLDVHAPALTAWTRRGESCWKLSLKGALSQKAWTLDFCSGAADAGEGTKDQACLTGTFGGDSWSYSDEQELEDRGDVHRGDLPRSWKALDGLRRALGVSISLRLRPELLGGSSRPSRDATVGFSGEGLAAVIAGLTLARDGRLDRLEGRLRGLVPGLRRVRVEEVRVSRPVQRSVAVDGAKTTLFVPEERVEYAVLLDFEHANGLRGDEVSDGTWLILGILAALEGGPPMDNGLPRLLLIDDVEAGLHPALQEQLMAMLGGLVQAQPELQIVVTTHSPFIIDAGPAAHTWLLAARADGSSATRRLVDHPEAARALMSLTPAEFWTAEGESWVAGEEQG